MMAGLPKLALCLIVALIGMSLGHPEPRNFGSGRPRGCNPNQACTFEYDPQCANDGTTYANTCQFGVAFCEDSSLRVEYRGECRSRRKRCAQVCPTIDAPVCGTDGKTYPNQCRLEAAACADSSIERAYAGECRIGRPSCNPNVGCSIDYVPVCGSDGTTYRNDCTFKAAACEKPGLKKDYEGECRIGRPICNPNTGCSIDYVPVCGSDGTTYRNDCTFKAAACEKPGLKKDYEGECRIGRPICNPNTGCSVDYVPVCGSDGTTYRNDCTFKAAACEKPGLEKVSDGECRSRGKRCAPVICTADYAPVCGTDGKTYSNICNLQAAASCSNGRIRKDHDGECKGKCSPVCLEIYAPVCGSDGKTYGNDCELNYASCKDPSIYKVYQGECKKCSSVCFEIYAPVCGSDGKTYSNDCELEYASCKDPSISKVSDGECN